MRFALAFVALLAVGSAPALADAEDTHDGVVRTKHFEIRFRPATHAAASVDRTAVIAERDLDFICKTLEMPAPAQLRLYLYDDVPELSALTATQGNGGFSCVPKDGIPTSHIPFDNDQTRLHEMVHIVAVTLKPTGTETRNLFSAEGLANAVLEFVHGTHVHATAAYFKKKGQLPALTEVMTGDFYAWLGKHPGIDAYDIGGSWFRFLLDKHGAEKTKRYYTGTPAKAAFGSDLPDLEKAWLAFLEKYPLRPEVEVVLRRRFGEAAGFGLPPDVAGKPADWKSLDAAALDADDAAKWKRAEGKIVGTTNPADGNWSVCQLGKDTWGDCALRATIRTQAYCAVQLRLGDANQVMLVGNGTFVYRGDGPHASAPRPVVVAGANTFDVVVVRRSGVLDVWVDGDRVLTCATLRDPTTAGIGVAQGTATFEDVRIRELPRR